MAATAQNQLKLSLLENGIDFVRAGGESFFVKKRPEPRDLKYALLHLFSGALLILKERLQRHDPALLWVKPGKTVDFHRVQERLVKHAGVKLSERDSATLAAARELRNSIEHFEFEMNLEQAQRIVVDLTTFLEAFCGNHLGTSLENRLPFPLWKQLMGLREFVQARRDSWVKRAEPFQHASDDYLKSLSAPQYEHKVGMVEPMLIECLECGFDSAATMNDSDIALCTRLDCRAVSEMNFCRVCLTPSTGDMCRTHRDEEDVLWEIAYDKAVENNPNAEAALLELERRGRRVR